MLARRRGVQDPLVRRREPGRPHRQPRGDDRPMKRAPLVTCVLGGVAAIALAGVRRRLPEHRRGQAARRHHHAGQSGNARPAAARLGRAHDVHHRRHRAAARRHDRHVVQRLREHPRPARDRVGLERPQRPRGQRRRAIQRVAEHPGSRGRRLRRRAHLGGRSGIRARRSGPYENADGTPDPPQCSDGIDNNHNGLIDYPADPGCYAPIDNTEDLGTYASGASETLFFQSPRVSLVRGYDPANGGAGNATDFPNSQVSIDTGWRGGTSYAFSTVVIGLTSSGFYVEDLQNDLASPPGYNGLFAYNFSTPSFMRVCDRHQVLSGTASDFYGFTELNYPTWQLEYWDPTERPCLVPEPTVLGVVDLNNDNRSGRSRRRSARVQTAPVVAVQVAGHFGPGRRPPGQRRLRPTRRRATATSITTARSTTRTRQALRRASRAAAARRPTSAVRRAQCPVRDRSNFVIVTTRRAASTARASRRTPPRPISSTRSPRAATPSLRSPAWSRTSPGARSSRSTRAARTISSRTPTALRSPRTWLAFTREPRRTSTQTRSELN